MQRTAPERSAQRRAELGFEKLLSYRNQRILARIGAEAYNEVVTIAAKAGVVKEAERTDPAEIREIKDAANILNRIIENGAASATGYGGRVHFGAIGEKLAGMGGSNRYVRNRRTERRATELPTLYRVLRLYRNSLTHHQVPGGAALTALHGTIESVVELAEAGWGGPEGIETIRESLTEVHNLAIEPETTELRKRVDEFGTEASKLEEDNNDKRIRITELERRGEAGKAAAKDAEAQAEKLRRDLREAERTIGRLKKDNAEKAQTLNAAWATIKNVRNERDEAKRAGAKAEQEGSRVPARVRPYRISDGPKGGPDRERQDLKKIAERLEEAQPRIKKKQRIPDDANIFQPCVVYPAVWEAARAGIRSIEDWYEVEVVQALLAVHPEMVKRQVNTPKVEEWMLKLYRAIKPETS